jgi:hypothetical protein
LVSEEKYDLGGVVGAVIGVSDMEKVLQINFRIGYHSI